MSNGDSRSLVRLIAPKDFTEAMEVAGKLAASDLVPKAYRGKPANIVIAWEMGAEVGLSPMAALQSIAVIGGKPVMYGEAPLGVVMASGLLEEIAEEDDGEVATCTVKGKGWSKSITRTFSMEEARKARVFERDEQGNGKWTILAERWTYQSWPKDMRKYRARGRALKDVFADVLKGLDIGEAVRDMGDMTGSSPTVIETERTAENEFMPRRKDVDSPAPGPHGAAGPETDPPEATPVVGGIPQKRGPGRPRKVKTEEAPVEVHVPTPEPKAADNPPVDARQSVGKDSRDDIQAGGPAGAQDRESGQAAAAASVEPVQEEYAPPPAPTVEDGPQEFRIGQNDYKTAGITREQMMRTFQLVHDADKRLGKGYSRNVLAKMLRVAPEAASRNDLTWETAGRFIAALEQGIA